MPFHPGSPVIDSSANREKIVVTAVGTAQVSQVAYKQGAILKITGLMGDFYVGPTKTLAEAQTIVGNEYQSVLYQLPSTATTVWVDVETTNDEIQIVEV